MKQKTRNIIFPLSIIYIGAILNLFNLRSARMLFRHTVLDTVKEEQKEAVRQIVNGRDVKSLIYQLLSSMFDYINARKINISAV